MANDLMNLIFQELPMAATGCPRTLEGLFCRLAVHRMNENGRSWELAPDAYSNAPFGSLEYIEQAYEKGWAAIVHDGRLVGFEKEKTE